MKTYVNYILKYLHFFLAVSIIVLAIKSFQGQYVQPSTIIAMLLSMLVIGRTKKNKKFSK